MSSQDPTVEISNPEPHVWVYSITFYDALGRESHQVFNFHSESLNHDRAIAYKTIRKHIVRRSFDWWLGLQPILVRALGYSEDEVKALESAAE